MSVQLVNPGTNKPKVHEFKPSTMEKNKTHSVSQTALVSVRRKYHLDIDRQV